MTVWKSPWCGCCGSWVQHMRAAGFTVKVKEVEDLQSVKTEAEIPDDLQSCHTARVGGYVIEVHVPAADIKRLRSMARGKSAESICDTTTPPASQTRSADASDHDDAQSQS